ncbi:MAG: hypothetical protein IRZ02_04520 [Acidothermus sp.]|nr:hypothetical protein [Acidothermus sp.]
MSVMRLLRRIPDEERENGAAMLLVLALVLMVTAVTTLAIGAVVINQRGAGLDRMRIQAVDAAEAGIDISFATLQASSGTLVPCQVSQKLGSRASFTATLTYYADYPPTADQVINCSPSSGLTKVPQSVVIRSTGTAPTSYAGSGSLGSRTVETLLRLSTTPLAAFGFDKALFSNTDLQVTNQVTVTSTSGVNANIYTNGNFQCNSNPNVAGSVYAQGTAYVTNSCVVQGDLWAKGAVTGDSQPTIGGQVRSSTAGAKLQSTVKIKGDIILAGSLTITDGKSLPIANWQGKVYQGVTGMPLPPTLTLPVVTWPINLADWNNGLGETFSMLDWQVYVSTHAPNAKSWSQVFPSSGGTSYACTISSDSYSLNGPLVLPSTPTIFNAYTDGCSSTGISTQGNSTTIVVNADTAIFASSFTLSKVNIQSGDGKPHKLWIIVPWVNNTNADCTQSGVGSQSINTNSGLTIDPLLTTLMYTPGGYSGNNNVTMSGQLYACTLGIARNTLNLTYVPLGVPGAKVNQAQTYHVDVVYVREVPN